MSEARAVERRAPLSSTEAAFAGFALLRSRPYLLVGLSLLSLALGLVSAVLQVLIAGPATRELMAIQLQGAGAGDRPDAAAMMHAMAPIWRMNLILFPLILIFYAVSNAAVYRALLRPAERGFGYLRLGFDELRQLGAFLLFGLILFGVGIVCEIGAIIVAAVVAMALSPGHGVGSAGSPSLSVVLVAILIVLLIFVPQIFIGVRLSLSGPMTFAQKRVRLTGSWPVTRGRFWAMFGAYLLAGVIVVVAGVVLVVVSCAVTFALGGVAGMRALVAPDTTSLAAFLSPARIVVMLLNAPLAAFWIATQAAVPADLYRQIGVRPDPVAGGIDRSHALRLTDASAGAAL